MKEELLRIIKQHGHTQNDLSEILGITYQSVSLKINGKNEFTLGEVREIVRIYDISPEDAYNIFFKYDFERKPQLVKA